MYLMMEAEHLHSDDSGLNGSRLRLSLMFLHLHMSTFYDVQQIDELSLINNSITYMPEDFVLNQDVCIMLSLSI